MEKPKLIPAVTDSGITWDKWIEMVDIALLVMGYGKYNQGYKLADFTYWKTFYEGEKKAYMVGIGFYDIRQHNIARIGIQYECMVLCDDRIDMSVSKNITLMEFEEMARAFYDGMKKYVKNSEKPN